MKLYYVVIFFGWSQTQDVHCKIWGVLLKKTVSVKFLMQYSFEEFMFAYSGRSFSWTFRKLFDQGHHSQGWQAFIVNDCSAMLVNLTNTEEFLSSITRFFLYTEQKLEKSTFLIFVKNKISLQLNTWLSGLDFFVKDNCVQIQNKPSMILTSEPLFVNPQKWRCCHYVLRCTKIEVTV